MADKHNNDIIIICATKKTKHPILTNMRDCCLIPITTLASVYFSCLIDDIY